MTISFDYDLVINEEVKILKGEIKEDELKNETESGDEPLINEEFQKLLEKFLSEN